MVAPWWWVMSTPGCPRRSRSAPPTSRPAYGAPPKASVQRLLDTAGGLLDLCPRRRRSPAAPARSSARPARSSAAGLLRSSAAPARSSARACSVRCCACRIVRCACRVRCRARPVFRRASRTASAVSRTRRRTRSAPARAACDAAASPGRPGVTPVALAGRAGAPAEGAGSSGMAIATQPAATPAATQPATILVARVPPTAPADASTLPRRRPLPGARRHLRGALEQPRGLLAPPRRRARRAWSPTAPRGAGRRRSPGSRCTTPGGVRVASGEAPRSPIRATAHEACWRSRRIARLRSRPRARRRAGGARCRRACARDARSRRDWRRHRRARGPAIAAVPRRVRARAGRPALPAPLAALRVWR